MKENINEIIATSFFWTKLLAEQMNLQALLYS